MKISKLRKDSAALSAGVWQSPGEEYAGVQFKVRPLDTPSYVDARGAMLRRASQPYGGDQTRIPNAVVTDIVTDCLLAHILLDVKGLELEDGSPVTMQQMPDLMRDPDYSDLNNTVIRAAAIVGTIRAADIKDAGGNSEKPSGGT